MSAVCEMNLDSFFIAVECAELDHICIRVAFILSFHSALTTPVMRHYWILPYEYFTVKQNQLHILLEKLSWGHVVKIVKLLIIRNDWLSKGWTVT